MWTREGTPGISPPAGQHRRTSASDRAPDQTHASQGTGPDIAAALAGQGMPLVLAARDAERLDEVAARLPTRRVVAVPTDVRKATDRTQMKQLFTR